MNIDITIIVYIFLFLILVLLFFYFDNKVLGSHKIKEHMTSTCSVESLSSNEFPENWFDKGTYRSNNLIWTPNYVDINYQPSTSTNYFYRNGYFYPV